MTIRQWFAVAAGSITGRHHVLAGKNSQDAYAWEMSDEALIAVVCDGCGSGKHSEVGAKLGARALVNSISRQLQHTPLVQWSQVEQELLAYLCHIADGLGEDMTTTVRDYLLFTIVGVCLTPAQTVVFALGDGVFAVNETLTQLGPFANNAPPYLAYRLLDRVGFPAPMLSLRVQRCLPTAAVQSLLIGSDGLTALIQSAEHPMPGQQTPVGPLCQFWRQERYFTNPDMVRRTLARCSRDVVYPDGPGQRLQRFPGLLPDDTTLVVVRRAAVQ